MNRLTDMTTFLQLIQIAMGLREPSLERPLSRNEWQEIYAVAKKQAVLGILSPLAVLLPREQLVLGVESYLLLYAEKVRAKNEEMAGYAAEITRSFDELGLRTCILKGLGVARLYPDPGIRQSGDIDIWAEGNIKDIIKTVSRKWKVVNVFYHHADISPLGRKCSVELHFCPTWMNNPFSNRRLQKYFRTQSELQFSNRSAESGFSSTTLAFDCCYSAIHIYRHLLFEGVGLRQLMDYYYILKNSSESDRKEAAALLDSLKMNRFVRALMYALRYFFRLEEQFFLCEPDPEYGEFFISEVMISGNFGTYDSRFTIKPADGLLKKFMIRIRRLDHYRKIAPSEVFWAPFFKVWQFFWKKFNNW